MFKREHTLKKTQNYFNINLLDLKIHMTVYIKKNRNGLSLI